MLNCLKWNSHQFIFQPFPSIVAGYRPVCLPATRNPQPAEINAVLGPGEKGEWLTLRSTP